MSISVQEYRQMIGIQPRKTAKPNKYHAKKVRTLYGLFDSQHEADEYAKLVMRQKAGEISNLRRQVRYEIIPQQTETYTKQLKTKTKECTRVVEQSAHYTADFVYWDNRLMKEVVVDAKSKATRELADYILRRKLMLYINGIKIREL